MCWCNDFEAPSVLDDTLRTARKQHRCYECSRPIVPGQKYHDISGCWDGSWSDYKVCQRCERVRLALAEYEKEDYGCLCLAPYGGLRWQLRNREKRQEAQP